MNTNQNNSRKTNIVLIGMPGAGKSTAGVIAAKTLGMRFLDVDLLIQEEEDRLLSEIIAEKGVDGFLEVENRVGRSIEAQRTIIATGGSMVYGKEAMAHLKEIGLIVYLSLPFATLENRLSDLRGRGVVLKEGQTLRDLYLERTPLYEMYADVVIDTGALTLEQTREALENLAGRNCRKSQGNN